VVKREFQGLQIGILNRSVTVKITELWAVKVKTGILYHPVIVKITELLTIQWNSLQGDSLNFSQHPRNLFNFLYIKKLRR